MSDIELHESILKGIHDTYIRKNNDYGDSFGKSFSKYGVTAAMVRMADKWNRLESLTSGIKQMVNDESVRDTLLDLANYCIMTVMQMDKREKAELDKFVGLANAMESELSDRNKDN